VRSGFAGAAGAGRAAGIDAGFAAGIAGGFAAGTAGFAAGIAGFAAGIAAGFAAFGAGFRATFLTAFFALLARDADFFAARLIDLPFMLLFFFAAFLAFARPAFFERAVFFAISPSNSATPNRAPINPGVIVP
jgi:hypothetical protein